MKNNICFLLFLILIITCPDFASASSGKAPEKDGEYSIEVSLEGGSGKASVTTPTVMTVRQGTSYAHLQWSSPNYDYMIVDGKKYDNQSEGNAASTFEIPITVFDQPMEVIADTTAMGTPHEINYKLTFFADSVGSKGQLPQESAKRVFAVALFIIIGGGILNHFVKKHYYS